MSLSKDQALVVINAGALLPFAFGELSDFELELVSEVSFRWMRHGREAVVTDLEWPVMERAVDAMRAGLKAGRATIPTAYRIAA